MFESISDCTYKTLWSYLSFAFTQYWDSLLKCVLELSISSACVFLLWFFSFDFSLLLSYHFLIQASSLSHLNKIFAQWIGTLSLFLADVKHPSKVLMTCSCSSIFSYFPKHDAFSALKSMVWNPLFYLAGTRKKKKKN